MSTLSPCCLTVSTLLRVFSHLEVLPHSRAPKPKTEGPLAETKNQNEAFLLLSCLSQKPYYGS